MSHVPSLLGERRAVTVAGVVLAGVGEALGAGAIAFATRELFAALHGGTTLPPRALGLLLLGALTLALLRVVGRTLAERLGQSYAISMRRALYARFAALPQSTLDERRGGALALRFVGDLTALRAWAGLGLGRLVAALIVTLGAALVLWRFDPRLAAAAFVPIALAVALALLAALAMRPLQRRLRARRGRIAVDMSERARLAPQLDLLGRTSRELARLDADGRTLRRRAVARAALVSTLRAIPGLGVAVAGVLVLVATARFGLAASDAAGALALLGIVSLALRELASVWDRFCAWRIALAKCERLLRFAPRTERPRARRRTAAADTPGAAVGLHFEAVGYRDLSAELAIAPGERVLVSGEAGAGKSTLLALAAALEQPERGRVRRTRADGDGEPTLLHVSSRSPILRGSLRRALTLGLRPRPSDERLARLLERLALAPLAERLGGLDGRVAEAGADLSTLERERLLLARALLSPAGLLLVDLPALGYDRVMRDAFGERFAAAGGASPTIVLALSAGLSAPPPAGWAYCPIEDGVARRDAAAREGGALRPVA